MNPLRYRGYVYDHETGLYYLESRYYNPKIGRFLTADIFASTGQGFVGNNMFAYCGNNPVVRVEVEGCLYDTIFDAFSAAVSLWEVICNPSSGEAWLALGLDAACLVFPFVTGGGTVTRFFSKADEVVRTANIVDNVDETIDAFTHSSKLEDVIDNSFSSKFVNEVSTLPRTGSALKQDAFHAFPDIVDHYATSGLKIDLGNATLYQVSGAYRGMEGRFEWIVQAGIVRHRLFVNGGKLNEISTKP